MYIYQNKDWPNFFWDSKVIDPLLLSLRYQQGHLMGEMESIGFKIQQETVVKTLTQDVVKSSEIEGEFLDPTLVRSSVARHLGVPIAGLNVMDRNVEGVVEMVLDATQGFERPLTRERLFNWHSLLFPNGRTGFFKISIGSWRKGSVEVISGRPGKEKIHFEGPPAREVEREMNSFLQWINENTQMDLVLKAAIAHLWFVTIHPFDDGNGRIGRAIADFLLARSENTSQRFYSLSAQIQAKRKHYYSMLEQTQKGSLDITLWLKWFCECLAEAIHEATTVFEKILHKAKFWDAIKNVSLNERQKKIVNLLLEGMEGKLTSSKWAKIAHCSQDTAYRDILNLIHQGILKKNPETGRSTSYSLSSTRY